MTTSSGSKGNAKGKLTDTKLHNAVLKTLCALSQQVREVRGAVFMCWMIMQEAPEYKRPCAPTRSRRHQRERDTDSDQQGLQRLRSSYKHCRREAARWERPTRQECQTSSTYGTIWRERAFDLVPHCNLAKILRPSSVPSRARHQRGRASRTHSWCNRTNRSESSSRSSSKRALERALSSAIEQS